MALFRAIIGRGKYRFKEVSYQSLQVAENKWFKMTTDQRQTHLRKVLTMPVKNSQPMPGSLEMSVDVQSVSELVNIPLPCFEGIWKEGNYITEYITCCFLSTWGIQMRPEW